MATRAAKAEMDALARKRLDVATKTLQERFGFAPLPARTLVRDPEFVRIQETEDYATVLESVVAATAPKAAKKADAKDDEPVKADAKTEAKKK